MRTKLGGMTVAAVSFIVLLAAPAGADGDEEYLDVANSVLDGEPPIEDFQELREAYTETSWYNPAPDITWLEELDAALDEGDMEEADEFINANYFYFMPVMDFHLSAMATYRELGDEETLEWHNWFFDRLVDSIIDSGDGESPETAYKTVYEREQMIILEILGLEIDDRRQERHDDRLYYVYEATDPEGGSQEVYFDFTAADEWRERNEE